MPRTTATIPGDLYRLLEVAVEAGIFENMSDCVRHVLREYFAANQAARTAVAVSLYETGDITIGTAVRLADVNRFEMRDILQEENVELRLGLEDTEEIKEETDAARDLEYQ